MRANELYAGLPLAPAHGGEGGGMLTSSRVRLTVRTTTSASRLVLAEALIGPLIAWANDSKMDLIVSKLLLVCSESKYFPPAKTQFSDTKG